jgi:predicted transposase/invertase (TIGR01784 family)
MKFLDIRTDFAFKKVFGSKDSKPRLISFLNSIIEFNDHCLITDLEIIDPYNVPKLKGMKDSFVDVKAILTDKTTVIIEMQVLNHEGFEKRVLYNAAKNYSVQLDKGEQYHLLKPVIALSIVNFEMFNDNDDLINAFQLMNKKHFTTYHNDIELIFVELKKFTKIQEECEGIQDDWIFFLKNAGDLALIPKDLPEPVQSAYEISNEAGMSKEELEMQYKHKEWISVQISALSLAEKKGKTEGEAIGEARGKAEGEAIGEARGKAEAVKVVAASMLRNGLTIDQVVQVTGLTAEQLAGL